MLLSSRMKIPAGIILRSNLALDSAAGTAFKWLILGRLFFIAGLCVLTLANVSERGGVDHALLTLPWSGAGGAYKLAMKVVVLIIGLPLRIGRLPSWPTVNAVADPMRFGLIGGGVGAGLALLFVLGSGLAGAESLR